jgi:hypothetical protein
MARICRHAASEIARARWWLRTMFRTLRSSITTAWFSRTSRVVSELVQEIFPAVTDPGMHPRGPEPGLVPVRGALLRAGHPPLRQREPCPVAPFVPGAGDLLPGREGDQGRDPRVDAGDRIAGRMGLDRALAQQGHEPAAGRIPADGHRGRLGAVRQRARPDHGQRCGHLREVQLAAAVPERRPGVLRRGARLLPRLEPGVAGLGVPEPGERRTGGRSRVPAAGPTPLCALRARGCRPCGRSRRSGTVPPPAPESGRSGAAFPSRPEGRGLHAATQMTSRPSCSSSPRRRACLAAVSGPPSSGRDEAGRRPAGNGVRLSEGRQGTEPMLTTCRYLSTYCVELGEPERWGKHLDREGNAMRDTWT